MHGFLMQKYVGMTTLVVVVLGLLGVWLAVGGFPIVVSHHPQDVSPVVLAKASIVNPLQDIDMTEGKAILWLVADDWEDLPQGMPTRRVLMCTDARVLQQLKDNFSFEVSGGDMSTVESELWVYSHDSLVFMSNIVIENDVVGLQCNKVGWLESVEKDKLCRLFEKFRPCHSPFISFP